MDLIIAMILSSKIQTINTPQIAREDKITFNVSLCYNETGRYWVLLVIGVYTINETNSFIAGCE